MSDAGQKINGWKSEYNPSREQFADWLRLSRLMLSLTQIEIAKLLDMPFTEFAAYERAREMPDDETRQKIMETVGLQLICVFENK